MDQDKIIAAILANGLGAQGKFDDASGAVSAYQAILSKLNADGHAASGDHGSAPLIVGQDEGLADGHETALRNLHF